MVCEWGMSEKLGPLAYGKKEESIFLGRDYGQRTQDYSEQTAQRDRPGGARASSQRQYARGEGRSSRENREKLERAGRRAHRARDARRRGDRRRRSRAASSRSASKVVIPTYAEKDKASKEKRRVASIFGGPPKPATSGS